VYRRLAHLETQGLVRKQGWPRKWSLIDDRGKVSEYCFNRLWNLKSTQHSTLQDLEQRLEFDKFLSEADDEVIIRYLLHHGDPKGFLRKEKLVHNFMKFTERERKHRATPYLDRVSEQRGYRRLDRSQRH